jgi:hypothetical protein
MFKTLYTFRFGFYSEIESMVNISAVKIFTQLKTAGEEKRKAKNTIIYSHYVAYNLRGKISSDTAQYKA